jgi:hypothetical protein
MVKYRHPPTPDPAAVKSTAPIRVRYTWRISGSFSEDYDGVATGWAQTPSGRSVVRVESDAGPSGWVWAEEVKRL